MGRSEDVVTVAGADAPSPEPPTPGRRANGTFAPGNTASMTHGLHSRQVRNALLPEQAEVLASLAAQRQAIEDDLGGPDALTILSRDLVGRYLELNLIADHLARNLATQGPLTTKGRQRAALSAYLGVVDRLQRVALALGLERKAKRVPSLAEVLDGK